MGQGSTGDRLEEAVRDTLNVLRPFIEVIFRRELPDAYYQAYVFSLALRAFQNLGAEIELQGTQGSPGPFAFRGAPGRIHSAQDNYTVMPYVPTTVGSSKCMWTCNSRELRALSMKST